jgi:hypothetical protein
MKYAVEMGSGAMIYVIKFHKDWFRHSKVSNKKQTNKLWGFSPPANYTDQATPLVGEVSANFGG